MQRGDPTLTCWEYSIIPSRPNENKQLLALLTEQHILVNGLLALPTEQHILVNGRSRVEHGITEVHEVSAPERRKQAGNSIALSLFLLSAVFYMTATFQCLHFFPCSMP